jgi:hypothetical protein
MPASVIDKPLAIHAAKQPFRPDDWGDELLQQLRADDVSGPWGYGCFLCVVHPQRSIKVGDARIRFAMADAGRARRELAYGYYVDIDPDSGKQRWATKLNDIRVLPHPVPYVGRQGIFNWPEGDALYQELW